jgi:hypothetical protein
MRKARVVSTEQHLSVTAERRRWDDANRARHAAYDRARRLRTRSLPTPPFEEPEERPHR